MTQSDDKKPPHRWTIVPEGQHDSTASPWPSWCYACQQHHEPHTGCPGVYYQSIEELTRAR